MSTQHLHATPLTVCVGQRQSEGAHLLESQEGREILYSGGGTLHAQHTLKDKGDHTFLELLKSARSAS